MSEIATERLELARPTPADLPFLTAMNADPEVMAHFVAPLSAEETAAGLGRMQAHHDQHGFGLWMVRAGGEPVGWCGLMRVGFEPVLGEVEIGWRFARPAWGHGYAVEAARACLAHGFTRLGLPRIVSFTVPENTRSLAVMRRLGMTLVGRFEHPRVPAGHRLRPHVIQAIDRQAWARRIEAVHPAGSMTLVRQLFREYQAAIGVDLCFQGFEAELAGLPGSYAQGGIWLAWHELAPVGCVALRPQAEGAAELKRLFVRPEGRGLGLARRLTETAIAAARELGHRAVRLDTLATMTQAIALYRSLGFVEIPPYTPNPLPGPRFFELRLQ